MEDWTDNTAEFECCFCKKKIKYGNNIAPIITTYGNCCCDLCNDNIVIPTRMNLFKENKNVT